MAIEAIRLVTRAAGLEDSSAEYKRIIDELRAFPLTVLKPMITSTYGGQRHCWVVCDALNWQAAYPLIQLIAATAARKHLYNDHDATDCPNSSDPTSGVLNVAEVKAALENAGERLSREVFKVMRADQYNSVRNTVTLFEATAGWNRDKMLKSFKSRSQLGTKAYGVLPLQHGADEVLERYLALRESARDGQKFGQMRRANHAAAIKAGLANLAQVAGYADAIRLEWDMEAKITQEIASDGHIWQAGSYQIRFNVIGAEANLSIERDGRVLKSVPQEVRATDAYAAAKESLEQFRAQAKRLRTELLEALLMSGDTLTPDELTGLLRFPAAVDMLQRLVLCTEDNHFGIFQADDMVLRDVDGKQHPITNRVKVAHSYHLYQAGVLSAWQREIIHHRIIQPFKQVFRELYLLTPAEINTRTYSNRFAGHVVEGSIAARLFGTRGWRIDRSYDSVRPYKIFGNLRAVFDVAGYWHFFGGREPVTTDRIFFQSNDVNQRLYGHDEINSFIPLEQIDPLIFSEVMRDADLVVSVAQRDGENRLSNEIYEQRSSLVRTLVDDLGLPGVTTEGHFAYVQGKLARYRVHLGSAVIHIEPGNYLCIVPDRWGQTHEKLFLPFAYDRDNKISEVISKILLLTADDQIKDSSILRQIKT